MEQQPATEESREHHDQYLPLPASSVRELKEEKVVNKRAADERRKKEQVVKLNLAGVAVSLNVRLRSADMPPVMQERAFRFTRSLLFPPHHQTTPSTNPNPSSTQIARALKKEFDRWYGPAWHCVVGKSFGSFVTHSEGGFLYFSVDNLSVLLFKTAVRPVMLDMDMDIRPSSYKEKKKLSCNSNTLNLN